MKKFDFLKRKWQVFITSKKDTAYMLNYLTLWIKDKQVRTDFLTHLIQQRILTHWVSVVIATLYTLFQVYIYCTGGEIYSLLNVVIYFFYFALLNTVLLFRYKNGMRWTPSLCLISLVILSAYAASPIGEHMATKVSKELILNNNFLALVICSVIASQSDLWTSCLLQLPAFIASSIIIRIYISQQRIYIQSLLPSEHQYLIQETS